MKEHRLATKRSLKPIKVRIEFAVGTALKRVKQETHPISPRADYCIFEG